MEIAACEGWVKTFISIDQFQSLSTLLNKQTKMGKSNSCIFLYFKYLSRSQTGAIYLPEKFYVSALAHVLLIKKARAWEQMIFFSKTKFSCSFILIT